MPGGTLIVSRAKNILPFWRYYLKIVGFQNVVVTSEEKDSLVRVINDMKPRLVFIESCFYEAATPYMTGRLLRDFPKLRIAAFSVGEFPDDLAVWFYFHGVKNYINFRDGMCEFKRGIQKILLGEEFRSKKVQRRIDLRTEIPKPAYSFTNRQMEVLLLLCNGFTTDEVGDVLHISRRTVETHKTDLYAVFHVRNERELIRVSYYMDLFKKDELCFYGGKWEVPPLPESATA
ncbi:MAG: LuxR C-terminal-related transcriptional regulator [Treponema sp.]|jgi:DNA-binding NarL/FixJ family response regulator|nr:LuxR C-terminal-related transcriptional regulator [Treponema sp.]